MYVVFVVLVKYKIVMAMCSSKNIKSELFLEDDNVISSEEETELLKFTFSKEEINGFYISLNICKEMSISLIKHIENLQTVCNNGDGGTSVLASIRKCSRKVAKIRKSFEDHLVCQYELVKFYELFFRVLYYIMKYKENLKVNFFQFSVNTIMPILKKLKLRLNFYQTYRCFDLTIEKLHNQEINEKERCQSLLKLLSKFFEYHNIIVSDIRIYENYTSREILSLCYNIFARFYLCNSNMILDFYKNFILRKYSLLDQLLIFACIDGFVTKSAHEVRFELKRFLISNHLDLDAKFSEKGLIPPISDVINKHSFTLGLQPINF